MLQHNFKIDVINYDDDANDDVTEIYVEEEGFFNVMDF